MSILSFLPKPVKQAALSLTAIVSSCSPGPNQPVTPQKTTIPLEGKILVIEQLQTDNELLIKAYCGKNEEEYALLLKEEGEYQILLGRKLTEDENSCLYNIIETLENQSN